MGKRYYDVKITVLKRVEIPEIHKEFAAGDNHTYCARYKEGQEYISQNVCKPDGLCSWAWPGMQDKVVFLALGHDYPWISRKGTEIYCCPDGLHPVIYKLERIED